MRRETILQMINRLGSLPNTTMILILFVLHSSLFLSMYIAMASAERANFRGETSMFGWLILPTMLFRLAVVLCVAYLVSIGSWADKISPYVLPLSILPAIFTNLAFITPLQRRFGFCSGGIRIAMFMDAMVLGSIGVVAGLIFAVIVTRH